MVYGGTPYRSNEVCLFAKILNLIYNVLAYLTNNTNLLFIYFKMITYHFRHKSNTSIVSFTPPGQPEKSVTILN